MRIGYARVSTKKEDQKQALEQQIDRLKCAGAEKIFVDIESGANDNRPGLQQLIDTVRSGTVSEAIVTHLTRLGRSIIGIQKVVDIFRANKVKLKVLDGFGDLDSAAGRATIANMAVWAQYERELISERVSNGWEYVRKLKKAVNAPFGYLIVSGKYELDCTLVTGNEGDKISRATVGREIVETFITKRSLRLTVRDMARKYPELLRQGKGKIKGLPKSVDGLRNWLQNPVLRGHTRYKKRSDLLPQIHYNTHPEECLMSESEFSLIQAILKFNSEHHGFKNALPCYPLSGLIYCICGTTAHLIGSEKGGKYYQCRKYTLGQCSQKKAVREITALLSVVEKLIERADALADIASADPDFIEPPEIAELRRELIYYQAAPGKRAEAIVTDLKTQIEALTLASSQQSSADMVNRVRLVRNFGDRLFWTTLSDADKRLCFQNLVKRVTIKDGQVESVELKV